MDRFPETSWDPDLEGVETLLAAAPVLDSGMIPTASNYVFLIEMADDAAGTGYGVYKPERGEAPLWDFPPSLYKREVAAYLVSEALGWRVVPPTIARGDGLEHGTGSLQLYIPNDQQRTFFDLRDDHGERMRQFATFDWLINNADRKGGHVLIDARDRIWGIDNGLAFHVEEKLRTVIWDYAEEAVPSQLLPDIKRLCGDLEGDSALRRALSDFLDSDELEMLHSRAVEILRERTLPQPPDWRRPYPWPLI